MDTKAVWDVQSTEIFVNACVDQIYKKERRGQSFTPKAWQAIIETFTDKTGKHYGKKQFKNRLDVLKKDLKIWDSLIKETGVGRNPVTNNVIASDDWWTEKLQTNEEDEDDVYRPTMHKEEGSGDSENEHFGVNPAVSTRVTDEMASIGITTERPSSTGPTASGSEPKRKRGEGSSRRKKQKLPVAKQIADAVSVIANVTMDRAATLTATQENSMSEVVKYLLELDDVKADKAFGVRCMRALESKTRRDVFVTLKRDPEYLMSYLHYIVEED